MCPVLFAWRYIPICFIFVVSWQLRLWQKWPTTSPKLLTVLLGWLKGLKALAKDLKKRLLELEPKFSTLDYSATLYPRKSVTIFALQNKTLKVNWTEITKTTVFWVAIEENNTAMLQYSNCSRASHWSQRTFRRLKSTLRFFNFDYCLWSSIDSRVHNTLLIWFVAMTDKQNETLCRSSRNVYFFWGDSKHLSTTFSVQSIAFWEKHFKMLLIDLRW